MLTGLVLEFEHPELGIRSLETIGETIEGDKNNFIDEKLARGEKGLFIKLSFSLGKILTRYIIYIKILFV